MKFTLHYEAIQSWQHCQLCAIRKNSNDTHNILHYSAFRMCFLRKYYLISKDPANQYINQSTAGVCVTWLKHQDEASCCCCFVPCGSSGKFQVHLASTNHVLIHLHITSNHRQTGVNGVWVLIYERATVNRIQLIHDDDWAFTSMEPKIGS